MTRDDMTDRELLEFAAKAAGIGFNDKRSPTGNVALYCGPSVGWWNPLDDDGDALRLAVQLKMWTHSGMGCFQNEPDPYAATRRAIVRAAAEIGRNMT
jgi:hypothetical protein